MNIATTLPRSPELMTPQDTVLLVVDVQAKLMPLIAGEKRILWNLRRLLDGAEAVGLGVLAAVIAQRRDPGPPPELATRPAAPSPR